MATIINLNKARKQKARVDAEKTAAENRVRFGRTKAQKQQDAAAEAETRHRLEQLRRERPADTTVDTAVDTSVVAAVVTAADGVADARPDES